jgi:hypothetical protein
VRGQLQIPAIAHHSLAPMFLYIPALEKKRLKQLNFLEFLLNLHNMIV